MKLLQQNQGVAFTPKYQFLHCAEIRIIILFNMMSKRLYNMMSTRLYIFIQGCIKRIDQKSIEMSL